jgi:hypothetical protein
MLFEYQFYRYLLFIHNFFYHSGFQMPFISIDKHGRLTEMNTTPNNDNNISNYNNMRDKVHEDSRRCALVRSFKLIVCLSI